MALDETRTGEPSFGIVDFCVCSKSALDRDDAAIANANIREFGGRGRPNVGGVPGRQWLVSSFFWPDIWRAIRQYRSHVIADEQNAR